MKKLVSLTLAAVMVVSLLCTSFSASFATGTKYVIDELTASKVDTYISEYSNVLFSADVKTSSFIKANSIDLYEGENVIAQLKDNGKNGDAKKGDGIYSANVTLFSNDVGTKSYSARIGSAESAAWEISYCKKVTDADFVVHDALWGKINALESSAQKKGKSDAAIVKEMYAYVASQPCIESISWDCEYSFSFIFESGIHSAYINWNMKNAERRAGSTSAPQVSETEACQKALDDFSTWTDPDFLVLRPFRNTPSQGDFSNEFYSGIARSVCQITGGTATDLIESAACPAALLNVDDYGFFIVDSHGQLSGGRSYMVLRKGNTSGYDFNADVSAGHIVTYSTSEVGVTGSFFTKYLGGSSTRLPDTFFYLVICYGVASNTLYNPLLSLGAKLVVGYSDSVSFTYDFAFSADVWSYMQRECATDTSRTYSYEEARQDAVRQNGNSDYSSGAVQRAYGDTTLCLVYDPYTAAETLTLNISACDMYINNTTKLTATVTPADASCYTLTWESTSPSVATVAADGTVTALSSGTTTIRCKLTDEIYPENNKTAECTVNVLGALAVTGLEVSCESLELYTGSTTKISASVLPENATNQRVHFASSDETIVTVSSDGTVSGIGAGNATITVTSEDGGFEKTIYCKVNIANFTTAVNVVGGDLPFENNSQYPWQMDFVDDRIAIVSTNAGMNSTSSTLTLTMQLPAGSVIRFDWKTSCEQRFDALSFAINGQGVAEIPSISGATNWATVAYTLQSDAVYTFRWSYTKDTSVMANSDKAWLDNIDVSIPNRTYTVRFFDFAGEVVDEQQVLHGQAAVAPTLPEVAGYSFVGWDTQFNEIRCDTDIHPIYTENEDVVYTVTFCDYDGTVIKTEQVIENSSATAPEIPVHDGMVFVGWDGDFSCITVDITITAQYVFFGDANGDNTVNTGDAVTILRYTVDLYTLSDTQRAAADFTGDNNINTGDAVAILRFTIA